MKKSGGLTLSLYREEMILITDGSDSILISYNGRGKNSRPQIRIAASNKFKITRLKEKMPNGETASYDDPQG